MPESTPNPTPTPNPEPEPPAVQSPSTAPMTQTVVSDIQKYWIIVLAILALVGWILSGVFMVSYKKTTDQLTLLQSQSTHQAGVTITKWQEINGKAYPVTIVKTVHDTQVVKEKTETKTETVIRSGVSVGVGYSTKLEPTGLIDADLIPLGPGNVQVWATGNTGEQVGGLAYRFNF